MTIYDHISGANVWTGSIAIPVADTPIKADSVNLGFQGLADRTQFLSASKSNLVGVNRFSGSNYFSGSTTIGGTDFDISSTNVQFDNSTNVEVSGSWYFTVAPETNGIVLDSSSNITYASGRSTTKLIPIITGAPLNLPTGYESSNNGYVSTTTDGDIWLVPLVLPHGAIVTTLRCGTVVTGIPGAGNEPKLGLVRTNPDLSTGGWAVLTTLQNITGAATSGTNIITTGTISHTIDNDSYTYIVQLTAAGGGATATQFSWLEVTFTDNILTNK